MYSKKLIPLASMERILKKSGAERVADNAKIILKKIIEEIGIEISEKAKQLARHAGRKTIKSQDIKLATKKYYKIQG